MNMLGWYFCMAPLRSVIIVESFSIPPIATGTTPAAGFAVSPERHSGTKSRPGCSQALRETSDIQTAILA